MKKSTKIVAAMMITALAVGSLSVYAAEASGQTGKWERPAFSKRMDGPKGWGKNWNKGEKPQRQQLTEEEKAAKLETMKENCKKMLDKQLAEGKITQEQYDEAIAKLESGEFEFPGNGFRGQRNGFGKSFGGNRQGGHRWQGKGFAKNAEQPAAQAET